MAGWLSALSEDAGQAVRGLLRHPGVSAAVVALLGVGVGVSTVAFSTVYGLLLRPLPWVDGHRMVRIETPRDGQPERRGPLFRRQFEALEEAAESFSQVAAYVPRALVWVGPDGPEELQGASVSRSLLPLLQGTLHLGQPFAEAGGRGGRAPDREPAVRRNPDGPPDRGRRRRGSCCGRGGGRLRAGAARGQRRAHGRPAVRVGAAAVSRSDR